MKNYIFYVIKLAVLVFLGYIGIMMVDIGNDRDIVLFMGFGLSMNFACFAYCGILLARQPDNF